MANDGQSNLTTTRASCPICGKPRVEAWRPFCSKRCADVDLGRWLGERYVIAGEAADPESGAPGSDPEAELDEA